MRTEGQVSADAEPRIRTAAETLAANRVTPGSLEELPEACRPRNLAEAYSVQSELASRLMAHGWGDRQGFKIGCTTSVMQEYLGIDHPCAGQILAARLHEGAADLCLGDFHRAGVECEIAVTLGHDLDTERVTAGPGATAGAIAYFRAAIEIVDARYRDYSTMSTPTLVADDFFQAAAVIGEPQVFTSSTCLADLTGRMSINGAQVGAGNGKDILGDPINALHWLAQHRLDLKDPLRAGDTILLGSVVQTQWISPTRVSPVKAEVEVEVEVDFAGLAPCQARFFA